MEEEREGWMRGRSSEGKGREEKWSYVQEESAQQVVVHYENSPVLLLEHWMPAKDDEENKQLVVAEKVHMLSVV